MKKSLDNSDSSSTSARDSRSSFPYEQYPNRPNANACPGREEGKNKVGENESAIRGSSSWLQVSFAHQLEIR